MTWLKTLKASILNLALIVSGGAILATPLAASAQSDPYENYIKTSKDFKAVKQDKEWALKAFPSWTYMPWTAHWLIGYTDESGKWSVDHGINGAFLDGNSMQKAIGEGKLKWIDKFHLRFYVDHTAGKGDLHMWDNPKAMGNHKNDVQGTGVRTKPLNDAMLKRLEDTIQKRMTMVKDSPNRAAYMLDDETSWGFFIHPCMWCVTDDHAAYTSWLKEIYGSNVPERGKWIGYNDIRNQLKTWSLATFDASPLMDEWSFNDSYWCNFVGELVEYGNTIDPGAPVGLEGAQSPNAFGGYDYAKLMRKVQYIEAYNMGSSQAVVRSFNPHNALPSVTTHFHKDVADDVWQVWYYLGHGNKGMIGWVEGWFDKTTNAPEAWTNEVAPTYLEAANKIGPLMTGAEWIHDGVAIYYNHPSIQLSWILDAEAFKTTWVNNNSDFKLGTSHLVAHAWENMLRDSGIQYNFINYVDVIQNGVPSEYKVLILPACYCLSDAEAKQIRKFCENGGTVIADFMPGLWDQHGKGRATGGVLDEFFGVKHDPNMKEADVFGGQLWVETNQDANYTYKTYADLLTNKNESTKDASGFDKAVRKMDVIKVNKVGKGTAILMNLSPQWYNAYRTESAAASAKRSTFMKPVHDAGLNRWVEIKGATDKEFGYEITYFQNKGRTIGFVTYNPELKVTQEGGGNSTGLKTDTIPVTLSFGKGGVRDMRDERTGKNLGAGKEFNFNWTMNQAIVFSFAGEPPR